MLAQPGPGPGPAPEPEEPFSRLVGPYVEGGMAFLSVGQDSFDPGFGFEVGFGVRLDRRVALNASFDWAFTEFERTPRVWDTATSLGAATTDGFRAVTGWLEGCDKEYVAFCFLGGMVAYLFLSLGYFGAGLIYAFGPLASTGFLGLNLTGSYEIGDGDGGGRLELGASSMWMFPQEYDGGIAAIGPTFGASLRLGPVRLGGRVGWFPRAVQVSGGDDRAAFTGLITVGVTR